MVVRSSFEAGVLGLVEARVGAGAAQEDRLGAAAEEEQAGADALGVGAGDGERGGADREGVEREIGAGAAGADLEDIDPPVGVGDARIEACRRAAGGEAGERTWRRRRRTPRWRGCRRRRRRARKALRGSARSTAPGARSRRHLRGDLRRRGGRRRRRDRWAAPTPRSASARGPDAARGCARAGALGGIAGDGRGQIDDRLRRLGGGEEIELPGGLGLLDAEQVTQAKAARAVAEERERGRFDGHLVHGRARRSRVGARLGAGRQGGDSRRGRARGAEAARRPDRWRRPPRSRSRPPRCRRRSIAAPDPGPRRRHGADERQRVALCGVRAT